MQHDPMRTGFVGVEVLWPRNVLGNLLLAVPRVLGQQPHLWTRGGAEWAGLCGRCRQGSRDEETVVPGAQTICSDCAGRMCKAPAEMTHQCSPAAAINPHHFRVGLAQLCAVDVYVRGLKRCASRKARCVSSKHKVREQQTHTHTHRSSLQLQWDLGCDLQAAAQAREGAGKAPANLHAWRSTAAAGLPAARAAAHHRGGGYTTATGSCPAHLHLRVALHGLPDHDGCGGQRRSPPRLARRKQHGGLAKRGADAHGGLYRSRKGKATGSR